MTMELDMDVEFEEEKLGLLSPVLGEISRSDLARVSPFTALLLDWCWPLPTCLCFKSA